MHALQWQLWVASLPAALPYALLAALFRWQLGCTALMWRVMRGIQPLPPFRRRLLCLLRDRFSSSSSTSGCNSSSGGCEASTYPGVDGGGSGSSLKQLSGSMLLFMPLLLLLPTTGWFYCAALLLHAACSLPRGAAGLAAHMLLLAAATPPEEEVAHAPLQPMTAVASGRSSVQYLTLLPPTADAAVLPPAALLALQHTVYVQQVRQVGYGGSSAGLLPALAQAWAASGGLPLGRVLAAALRGHALWLDPPVT